MENHRIKSLKSPGLFHFEVLSLPRVTEQNLQLRSLLINSSKKQRDTKWTRLQQKAASGSGRAEGRGRGTRGGPGAAQPTVTHHCTGVCILLPKLQRQVGHSLRHALHGHGFIVSEPVILQENRASDYRSAPQR